MSGDSKLIPCQERKDSVWNADKKGAQGINFLKLRRESS